MTVIDVSLNAVIERMITHDNVTAAEIRESVELVLTKLTVPEPQAVGTIVSIGHGEALYLFELRPVPGPARWLGHTEDGFYSWTEIIGRGRPTILSAVTALGTNERAHLCDAVIETAKMWRKINRWDADYGSASAPLANAVRDLIDHDGDLWQ